MLTNRYRATIANGASQSSAVRIGKGAMIKHVQGIGAALAGDAIVLIGSNDGETWRYMTDGTSALSGTMSENGADFAPANAVGYEWVKAETQTSGSAETQTGAKVIEIATIGE